MAYWLRPPRHRGPINLTAAFFHEGDQQMALANSKYPYIRAWGQLMGSTQEYVNGQIEQAQKDGAPSDAIYKTLSKWSTFAEVTNIDTRHRIETLLDAWRRR